MSGNKRYVSVKLPKEYYGERLDEFLEENPQFRSRAEAVKEILRIHFRDKNQK